MEKKRQKNPLATQYIKQIVNYLKSYLIKIANSKQLAC